VDTSPFFWVRVGRVGQCTANSLEDKAKKIHWEEEDSVVARSEVSVLYGGVVKGNELREAYIDAGSEEDGSDGDDDDLAVQQSESGM